MNPTSPQSNVENLLHATGATNDDAIEIKRLEAFLPLSSFCVSCVSSRPIKMRIEADAQRGFADL